MLPRRERRMEKVLFTLLGRRPWEGGIVPAEGGWFTLKEVVQGLRFMEAGFSLTTKGLELFFTTYRPPRFQLEGARVRVTPELASEDSLIPKEVEPPSLLHVGVRERSLLSVADRGLSAPQGQWIVLFADEERARRWKELRTSPVSLVQVEAEKASRHGCPFFALGGELFLARHVPPRFLELPRPPEAEKPKVARSKRREKPKEEKRPPLMPGSFLLTDGGLVEKQSGRRGRRQRRKRR